MPVNRALWNEPLTKTYVPNWHCPACEGGYLKHKPDSLHYFETSESRSAQAPDAWLPELIEYRFTALLICNNERCKEPVAVSGCGGVELVQTSHAGDCDYAEFFYAQNVSPSPPLFTLSTTFPDSVVAELHRAFISSWSDFPSAANHIRSAIEHLLDHVKEPRTKLGKSGKQERVPLHSRIISIASRDKELSDSLLAVKWIGNAGSHSDDLSRDDIFDALDIIELNLNDLFIRHRDRVKKLVASINMNRGPRRDER